MPKFNTGNPVGSADPRDLSDSAQVADELINGGRSSYIDRLGRSRKSWSGVEAQAAQQNAEFNADQASRTATFTNFLNSSGFEYLGTYAAGIEFTEYNQYVVDGGNAWFISPSQALPYTATGAGVPEGGALMSRGEAVLRQEIGEGVRRVDALAGLQALSGRFDGDAAELLSRSAPVYAMANPFDGGGGTFGWNSSDLSSSIVLSTATSTSVDDATDTLNLVGHPFSDGYAVITETAVDGLAVNQIYWIVNATADTFQLSDGFASTPVDLTGTTNVTLKHLLDPRKGVYVTAPGDPTGASGAWVRKEIVNFHAAWFGAVGDWDGGAGTDNSEPVQCAINFVRFDTNFGRSGARTLEFDGAKGYKHDSGLVVDGGNICIDMHGGSLVYTGSGIGLYSGHTDYLTNISAGYFLLSLKNIEIKATSPAAVCLQNDGYRLLSLSRVYTYGGDVGFRSEGAFGGAVVSHCYFQNHASIGVDVRQRNNLITFHNCSVLGVSAGSGWRFSQSGAENDSIFLIGCDSEGCTEGYEINVGIGPITLENCWAENNTRSIYVPTASAGNTNGVQIYGGQYDADIDFGDIGGPGALRGCKVDGVKLTNANLNINVDTGVQIGTNIYSGTSVLSFADGQTLQPPGLDGLTSAEFMPRYKNGHGVPFGTSDTKGIDGDLRWDDSQAYIKTDSTEWRTCQLHKFDDNSLPALGTGVSVDVAGLKMCRTANGGATTVATITGEYAGQELIIVGNDGGNTTISAGAVKLPGGSNITLGDNDVLHILCVIPSIDLWTTVSYTDNPV